MSGLFPFLTHINFPKTLMARAILKIQADSSLSGIEACPVTIACFPFCAYHTMSIHRASSVPFLSVRCLRRRLTEYGNTGSPNGKNKSLNGILKRLNRN